MTWPDWTGETVVIVGTGKGAVAEPLEPYRGKARFFVIKSSWRLAPWADALYGLDRGWWIANVGCPKFGGLKFTAAPSAAKVFGLTLVRVKARADILIKEKGVVGCGLNVGGGHSGFQAINLSVQFGANRIVLVGFDMHGGERWINGEPAVARSDPARTESWRKALDACAPQFDDLRVEVINATPGSALKAYLNKPMGEVFGWPSRPRSSLSTATSS